MSSLANPWNANLYDARHGFVSNLAADLIDLLDPKPGERILDLGCGTGTLANDIAKRGATVFGIDASAAMVEQARGKFPALRFEVGDARTFTLDAAVDAVFSNATLHWVRPPEQAIARIYAALEPGGRLVIELGGHGNVRQVLAAALEGGQALGYDLKPVVDINYFPSIGDYTTLLESAGFDVTLATLFDRPTRLDESEKGLGNWYQMFRPGVFDVIPASQHDAFLRVVGDLARPTLWHDGAWIADYRRLRVVAHRLPSDS
jgi:trans-aconitate methyltransferase